MKRDVRADEAQGRSSLGFWVAEGRGGYVAVAVLAMSLIFAAAAGLAEQRGGAASPSGRSSFSVRRPVNSGLSVAAAFFAAGVVVRSLNATLGQLDGRCWIGNAPKSASRLD
jgi:hypothetical protein